MYVGVPGVRVPVAIKEGVLDDVIKDELDGDIFKEPDTVTV